MSQQRWRLQRTKELWSGQSWFHRGISSEKYFVRQFDCCANMYSTCRQCNLMRPLWHMEPVGKHRYVIHDHKYEENAFKTAYYRPGMQFSKVSVWCTGGCGLGPQHQVNSAYGPGLMQRSGRTGKRLRWSGSFSIIEQSSLSCLRPFLNKERA